MKTYVTYGVAMTLAGAVLNLLLYFLGFHNDLAKISAGQWIGSCGGIAISITCLILGMKARRAEIPASEGFSYGRALGTGVMITLFAALLGLVTNYLYFHVINPDFREVMEQAQVAKMQARGMTDAQIERMQNFNKVFSNPIIQAAAGCVFVFLFGTIVSLIVAAFVKREPMEDAPPALG